jgi:hypothetical protein
VDSEGVHASRKLSGKRLIDHAVTLDAALSLERFRHDIDPEMGLPARAVSGMALMLMRLINHFEALRHESLGQLLCDEIGGSHIARLGERGFPVNATNKP